MLNRRDILLAGAAGAAGLLGGCAAPGDVRRSRAARHNPPAPWLDELERRSFQYFWDTADARTGLVPDRWPQPSFASVAAVGFGLSAYCIGAARGWVTREQARGRCLATLRFFHQAVQGPQAQGVSGYKGFFYHFLDIPSGHRHGRNELSTVDTALFLAGALHAQAFFTAADGAEREIRDLAQALYERVQWPWAQARGAAISHGWHPESGFIAYDWKGYNEALLVYLLALGSPTYPVGADAYEAWASTYPGSWGVAHDQAHGQAQGQAHLRFASFFGHHFTHAWVDMQGLADAFLRSKGLDYFENTRRATLAQHAYALHNPEGWAGYGADLWGVTASDGPADVQRAFGGRMRQFRSYAGRGMGGAAAYDDGTIAPYGAGCSLPFAPELVLPGLEAMWRRPHATGRYGFFAVNPSFSFADVALLHGRLVPGAGWVDTDFLGIEVGPLLLMLANHRDDQVWRVMRGQPWLLRGLQRAGFRGGWMG